eukprot:CAMPEP_0181530602 /NCGR_PEP_ID=MMETSP1110-20121109/71677_1 /TAXON_ID=174948 /ORGANISM="Symbiodinium sp., Strain CCMP421" /LENGTH=89 /DNA_ID=CAMNT_0023661661 /DNA_START=12 /DNA_END=282 /DNA_ORIENTATION=+
MTSHPVQLLCELPLIVPPPTFNFFGFPALTEAKFFPLLDDSKIGVKEAPDVFGSGQKQTLAWASRARSGGSSAGRTAVLGARGLHCLLQ